LYSLGNELTRNYYVFILFFYLHPFFFFLAPAAVRKAILHCHIAKRQKSVSSQLLFSIFSVGLASTPPLVNDI
jgi:hypothetical protein